MRRVGYCSGLVNHFRHMPLHFGKIFAAISLITIAAFVLWLLFTTFFATEQADEKIEHGAAERAVVPA